MSRENGQKKVEKKELFSIKIDSNPKIRAGSRSRVRAWEQRQFMQVIQLSDFGHTAHPFTTDVGHLFLSVTKFHRLKSLTKGQKLKNSRCSCLHTLNPLKTTFYGHQKIIAIRICSTMKHPNSYSITIPTNLLFVCYTSKHLYSFTFSGQLFSKPNQNSLNNKHLISH